MRLQLTPHPDTPCDAVERIEVEVTRAGAQIALRFRATGRIGALALPPPGPPRRADELWRHTCFEAFVRPAGGAAYLELNLSPSGQWAAYRFDGYRQGMRITPLPAPGIETAAADDRLDLAATVALDPGPVQVGLSAVIEEASGRISYWALAHPPGKPDFHHADGFGLELAERP